MKKLFCIISILVSVTSFAQETATNGGSATQGARAILGSEWASAGSTSLVVNESRAIDGSVYLFDTWRNNAVLEINKSSFKLKNINFDARKNVFVSQIPDTDSLFIFNFANIHKMVVNKRVFKNIYSPIEGNHKICEVVAEAGDYAIYRRYSIEIKEGNPNPMLAQTKDRYILKDTYFLKNGNTFKKVRIKKSTLLKSFGNKGKAVDDYARENNLSFKNEKELQKIVAYYTTL